MDFPVWLMESYQVTMMISHAVLAAVLFVTGLVLEDKTMFSRTDREEGRYKLVFKLAVLSFWQTIVYLTSYLPVYLLVPKGDREMGFAVFVIIAGIGSLALPIATWLIWEGVIGNIFGGIRRLFFPPPVSEAQLTQRKIDELTKFVDEAAREIADMRHSGTPVESQIKMMEGYIGTARERRGILVEQLADMKRVRFMGRLEEIG